MARMVRVFGVLLVALAISGGFFASQANAAGGATVVFHVRGCYTGAEQVYEDCHGVAGEGYLVGLPGASYPTDANGEVVLTNVPAGTYTVQIDTRLAVMSWYCSLEENLGQEDYVIMTGDNQLIVHDGDVIYCDIYAYAGDDPNGGSDGGTQMPDTGIGAADSNSLLPLALTGAVAAAGLAVATRRRAVR